jgi:hypothetical protein
MTTVTSPPASRAERLRAGARGWVALAHERPLAFSATALGVLMLLGAVNLYRKGLGLTFNYDEWNWVMNRRGWSAATLLNPHNEHLSLVPVLVFKLLFVTVGIDAYWPYRVAVILVHLLCVALVFVLVRRRLGDLFALVLAAMILFLGSAWQDLLWPFQIGYLGSVAAGLGMLLALERRDTTGRVLACVLLALAIASSSVGIPFAGVALVEVVLRRSGSWSSSQRWREVWVVAIPIALYAIWFVIYGNPNATPGNAHGFGLVRQNGPVIPSYAADMAANAFAGLAGLAIDWGRPLVVAALVIGIWWSARRYVNVRTLALLAGLGLFWGLTALLRAQLNAPADSRYIYPGAVLLVLLGAELFRGARPTGRAAAVAAALALFAAVANYGPLKAGSAQFQDWSTYVRAELGALEVAGPTAPPTLAPDPTRAPDITADRYFAAVRQLGSPADTPAEVRARPEPQREAADGVLVAGLQVGLHPASGITAVKVAPPALETSSGIATARSGACLSLRATAPGASAAFVVPDRGVVVGNAGPGNVEVRIRSFADNFPAAPLGSVPPNQAEVLAIPERSGLVWHAQLTEPGQARVCARG